MINWYEVLEDALHYAGSTHTVEDVLDEVERGDAQIWTSDDAVIVSEIYDYPEATVLHYWLAGGELQGVIELGRKVLAWGAEQGCTRASLNGRRGWAKALAAEQFVPETVIFTRDI